MYHHPQYFHFYGLTAVPCAVIGKFQLTAFSQLSHHRFGYNASAQVWRNEPAFWSSFPHSPLKANSLPFVTADIGLEGKALTPK